MGIEICQHEPVCSGSITNEWVEGAGEVIEHSISHHCDLSFFNYIVPVLHTERNFIATYSRSEKPKYSLGAKIDGRDGQIIDCNTAYNTADNWLSSVQENCSIERSTLCYLDQNSKVLLYKYEKDECSFNKTSTDFISWKAAFTIYTGKLVLLKSDVAAVRTVEWRLVKNNELIVLSSEVDNNFSPFGESFVGTTPDGLSTNPDIVQIICLPQPPSQSLATDSTILALEGYSNGFYDYGNLPGQESELNKSDGGNKDFFYPTWCRNMIADPIWRYISDRRYLVSMKQSSLLSDSEWSPQIINQDFIPKGNYVYHPTIGEAYQWLLEKRDGSSFIIESSEVFNRVRTLLPNNPSGTTLWFPLGVI